MMSQETAIYKFSYCGEIYYVTREDSERVYFNGSNGVSSSMRKEDLRKLFFDGKVDFGQERKPDFLEGAKV